MEKLSVAASKQYDVFLGRGVLGQIGALSRQIFGPVRILLVSDRRVAPLYTERVCASLTAAGFGVERLDIMAGEQAKTPKTLVEILEYAAKLRLTRNDIFAALGGGVIGDMVGLAAGLYLRGVSHIQIPTTLLSAVDSSVGGKTAVNLTSGKNLMGLFWQPSLVLCDLKTFSSLDDGVFADGVAEAVKYAAAFDGQLFEQLERGITKFDVPAPMVARCVQIKSDIVCGDEFDRGRRQLLNFGHTAGHAIEKLSRYEISHGRAVAAGMALMTRAGEAMGVCRKPFSKRLERLLEAYCLPVSCRFTPRQLADAAKTDKKHQGELITLVIPKKLGECELHTLESSQLEGVFEAGMSRRPKEVQG